MKNTAQNTVNIEFEIKLDALRSVSYDIRDKIKFLGILNENANFTYLLTSGRKVTLFRMLTVAPSADLFSNLATKPTKPVTVNSVNK
jgi:hypothetical protein